MEFKGTDVTRKQLKFLLCVSMVSSFVSSALSRFSESL